MQVRRGLWFPTLRLTWAGGNSLRFYAREGDLVADWMWNQSAARSGVAVAFMQGHTAVTFALALPPFPAKVADECAVDLSGIPRYFLEL